MLSKYNSSYFQADTSKQQEKQQNGEKEINRREHNKKNFWTHNNVLEWANDRTSTPNDNTQSQPKTE